MISIKKVKQIRDELNLTHIIIFGISDNNQMHVATHGKNRKQADQAAKIGNSIKNELDWPSDLCDSKPLPRICKYCEYFESIRTDENMGKCFLEPTILERLGTDISCKYFEPNC